MKNTLVATIAMLVAGSVMAEEIGSVSATINAANQNEAMTLFAKRKRNKKKKSKSHASRGAHKKKSRKSKRSSHSMDGAPSGAGNEAAPPPPTPAGGAPVSNENI